MLNIIYIISIIYACYFTQVEYVDVNDRDPNGKPLTWLVYFRNPLNQKQYRSLTFWPDYAPGDWLKVCGNEMPWGEWHFSRLPMLIK